ncbi:MAG: DUF3164 family protein [FCB group bacterium]|nr:DUF3164 family protein [FCB group bacterium]MBL7027441.1 DUF3164 family protein [Candidatus Neomarinimicrobiota bacterium]
MARKNDKGDWLDPQGNAILPKYVKALDKKRDATVERCVKKVARLKAIMLKVKEELFNEMENYENHLAEKYDIEAAEGGNLTLTSFSGDLQIVRSVQQIKQFNELLGTAKALIDECLVKWSEGSNQKLVTVVEKAFSVNVKGRVNHQAILGLRDLNIKDKKWVQAMDILNEAHVVVNSATYIRVMKRDEHGKYNNINLNFSNL